jgi:hypothetical protein
VTVYNTDAPAGDCCGLWPHGPPRIAHRPGDLTEPPLPASSRPFVHPERCPSFRLDPQRSSRLRRRAQERPNFVALPWAALGRAWNGLRNQVQGTSRPVAAGSNFDDFSFTHAKQRRADAPSVVLFAPIRWAMAWAALQCRRLPIRTLIVATAAPELGKIQRKERACRERAA